MGVVNTFESKLLRNRSDVPKVHLDLTLLHNMNYCATLMHNYLLLC